MVKVVLVQLPSPWLINDRDLPLMGVLYLAAALREANVEVQVADLCGLPEDKWYIPEGDIYGISITTPQVPVAYRVANLLRNRTHHRVRIVVGGPHVSALPEWSLSTFGAEAAFVGEADIAFPRWVRHIHPPKGIVRCAAPGVENLPYPARDLVDMRSFHSMKINSYVSDVRYEGYLQTGRGCPWNCHFCAQACITGRKVRFRKILDVLREIDVLRKKWECELIYIEDDTFVTNRERTLKMLRSFENYDTFKWHCLSRSDTMTQEIAHRMAEAGCQNVTFGFESGSDRILKAMNKGETVEQHLAAARAVKAAGMGIRGQMIVGYPGEDDDTITETAAFVREAPVDKWGFHAMQLLPGSWAWEHAADYGFQPSMTVEEFGRMQTIGKPDSWAKVWGDEERIKGWISDLRQIAAERVLA